ncbi:MAG: hypothetical protein ACRDIY_21750 [Chloroflexota bacterium]
MSYSYLIFAALVIFGAVGFWRGWLREVVTLASLLVVWMILDALGQTLVGFVNRVYLTLGFVARDGVDAAHPTALIQALRQNPLVDPRHPDFFLGVLLTVAVISIYFAASRFVAPAAGWSAQALGVLVGFANGYVVTYLGFRFFAPGARFELAFSLSPNGVADSLGRLLPTVLVAGVVLAVGIALLSGRRAASRGSGRPAAGRSKG